MAGEPRRKLDDVLDYLRSSIAEGRFVPGERLVEADLTAALGISRSLLREAFREIAAEGMIELIPNRGAMVRRLSLRETAELFEIRFELEALAARLAAACMDKPEVRAEFEKRIAQVWDDGDRVSASDYIIENQSFHDAIFAACGNMELARLNRQLQLTLIMAQISPALDTAVMSVSRDEHRGIARAILDSDGTRAARLLRAHLTRARDFTASRASASFRPD